VQHEVQRTDVRHLVPVDSAADEVTEKPAHLLRSHLAFEHLVQRIARREERDVGKVSLVSAPRLCHSGQLDSHLLLTGSRHRHRDAALDEAALDG
jgi:hypothetical protein